MLNALLTSIYVLVGSFRGLISFKGMAFSHYGHLGDIWRSMCLTWSRYDGILYISCHCLGSPETPLQHPLSTYKIGARPLSHPHSEPSNILLCECSNHHSKCDLAHSPGTNHNSLLRGGWGYLSVRLLVEACPNR